MGELTIPLPNGNTLRCAWGNPTRCGKYVRLVDKNDREIEYWSAMEIGEDPEVALAAIFSMALEFKWPEGRSNELFIEVKPETPTC